jgi:regulator of RNase E activity RraA
VAIDGSGPHLAAMSDRELLPRLRRTAYSPVIADVLDAVGCGHRILGPGLGTLAAGMVVCGRAMPVQWTDVAPPVAKPFGFLCEALDDLKPDEVWISSGSLASATWGELLTATARTRGAAGAVVDGWHRDTPAVLPQGFPVLSRGAWCADSLPRSAVHAWRVPVRVCGVVVDPGDLIFADGDGAVAVPRAVEAEVLERAFAKIAAEKVVRKAIEGGMGAGEAFRTYGVL